jgi:FMN-dependent oxidoreductase (nitrilotriacetate monooxygenase family)
MEGFRVPAWTREWSGTSSRDWPKGRFHIDMARDLERAGFDYFMIEDSSHIPDVYGGSMDVDLKLGRRAPKHDPLVLASIITQWTDRIGIIATVPITETTPYSLARTMSTLDHVSGGRIGWNVVTGSQDRTAQNFGIDKQPEHDLRYDMADDFVAAVKGLWSSWDDGAVVMDESTGVYVDGSKVHPIDHDGPFYKTRGPLNALPGPQGQPVLVQAGISPRGQRFSAENVDAIIASANSVEKMKELRTSIRAHAVAAGRDPDSIKIMFLAEPVLAETDAEAAEKIERRRLANEANYEFNLSTRSSITGVDFAQFDPDEPLPADLTTNGHQGVLKQMIDTGWTLRTWAGLPAQGVGGLDGTPETVAAKMDEIMQEVGGDGFLIYSTVLTRRYVSEIADGLVPHLQKRGLVRDGYEFAELRRNLMSF